MRLLATVMACLLLTGTALAGSPVDNAAYEHERVPCDMQYVCIDWDFTLGDQGFATGACDATGGLPVWAWGTSTVPGAPGTVWGTVLNANYPNNMGDALIAPAFTVTDCCHLLEVYHYYYFENNFDGSNVKANGVLITPVGGYDATISTSTTYYAYCVDNEPGFTGSFGTSWAWDCWDLSQFMGQSVELTFEVGSDSSVTYPGWYIAQIRIGGQMPSPADESTWGRIKGAFK
ncbi:MAG: hypothetical protein FJY75_00630 [Candidatus Eisenbacteria bacterium]|uniref:Uncharacterized protein n=1 Tax=Eiseniibacteriota bacterium TaxID=2212470 RepID=A0A937XAG6_UNCEI|nr:hypothetical protein [Candidatus Eisenbacteria bacterium]